MTEIANLAVPYFGLIAIGFAWGKANGPPEPGLALTKVFLLYVSLPAPLFVNTSKTSELDLFGKTAPHFSGSCSKHMRLGARAPRRRKPLAHCKPTQWSDRADQMQARSAERLRREKIAEQRTVRDIDDKGAAQHIGTPRDIITLQHARAARIFAVRQCLSDQLGNVIGIP